MSVIVTVDGTKLLDMNPQNLRFILDTKWKTQQQYHHCQDWMEAIGR